VGIALRVNAGWRRAANQVRAGVALALVSSCDRERQLNGFMGSWAVVGTPAGRPKVNNEITCQLYFKGRRENKMTKVTYICRSAKTKSVTYFTLFLFLFLCFIDFFKGVFWAFRNKGSSKTRKNFFNKDRVRFSTQLQLKNPLGEQELRHRSHFGQGERLCDFC
jgi:hypothetical protein